jgi:glycogen(starch) synthase
MKILYWTPQFWPEIGGIEVQAMKTLPVLKDRGHEILVVASHGSSKQPDKTYHEGIPVYRFPFWTALAKNDLGLIRKVCKEVTELKKSFNPDLIHINFSGYTIYYQLATAKDYPAPTVVRLATSLAELKAGPGTALGRLLGLADWIAAVSQSTLADALKVMPEITERSSVIHTGLQVPKVEPLPLRFDEPRILCYGRLTHEKGFDVAITALSSLVKRYPKLKMSIAGEGPERASLKQQVAEAGLTAAVEFAGKVHTDKVPDLLNEATIVVIPSRFRDPLPLVAIEAGQMARPVVASRVGGIPETVLDGQTGLLVGRGDAAGVAEAVSKLLDSPEKTQQMADEARSRVLKLFSFERYVNDYVNLYRKLYDISQDGKVLAEK